MQNLVSAARRGDTFRGFTGLTSERARSQLTFAVTSEIVDEALAKHIASRPTYFFLHGSLLYVVPSVLSKPAPAEKAMIQN